MKIHGQTEIVLKNVKTGLVERIRSENTFQGQFIAKYLRNVTGQTLNVCDDQANDQTLWPLWRNVVGGLFLFRDQIEEGTQYMPAGNVMIGAGIHGFTHSGAPTEWGSFNATESSAGLSGITQVYDFTTDQANGEIGCVCLTSKQGARIGYGHAGDTYLTRYSMAPRRTTYRIDYPGGYGFKDSSNREWAIVPRRYFDSNMPNYSQQIAGGKMYFDKRRFGFNSMSVFHDYEKPLEFDLTQIGGNPFSATASTTGSYYMYQLGGGKFGITVGGAIAEAAGKRYIPAGGTIYYYELDAIAETLTAKSVTNSTGEEIRYAGSNYSGVSSAITRDGCILCPGGTNSQSPLYKINLTSGITEKAFPSIYRFAGSYEYPGYGRGQEIAPGLQLYTKDQTSSKPVIYDKENDTIKPFNFDFGYFTEYNRELDVIQDESYSHQVSSGAATPNPLYLATINNITPVTKTAAQTMKVTYSLQEV